MREYGRGRAPSRRVVASRRTCTFLLDMQQARPSQKSWNICSSAFQRGGTSLSRCVPGGGASETLSNGTACRLSRSSAAAPEGSGAAGLGVGVGSSMRIVMGTRREVDLLKHIATICRRRRTCFASVPFLMSSGLTPSSYAMKLAPERLYERTWAEPNEGGGLRTKGRSDEQRGGRALCV